MDLSPWLVQIKQRGPEAVHESIAGRQHAVIEQEPAFGRLNRSRTGSDLGALPATFHTHHEAVSSPVDQMWAPADEDVAEGRMAVVARAAQQHVLPADPTGEEHTVAVERQEGILEEIEPGEGERVADPDRGSVIPVAPCHVEAVFQPDAPRVVAEGIAADLRILA